MTERIKVAMREYSLRGETIDNRRYAVVGKLNIINTMVRELRENYGCFQTGPVAFEIDNATFLELRFENRGQCLYNPMQRATTRITEIGASIVFSASSRYRVSYAITPPYLSTDPVPVPIISFLEPEGEWVEEHFRQIAAEAFVKFIHTAIAFPGSELK